jgi:ABC-type transport system substrate-binding protein/class 3 adenylate cyclase
MVCNSCGEQNPPEAKFCMSCGVALPDTTGHADPRLQVIQGSTPRELKERMVQAHTASIGQRKQVTILFTDIVNSTAIAEKLDPEEWKEVVQGAHKRVSEAVYRYEGTIAQLLGDGVLAFFGAPLTHEDDPERAVRAALDIQASLDAYRRKLAGFIDDFQMRVGIHTGEVVLGEVGTDEHNEYLAIGDATIVAARLQGAADPGAILVSDRCARLLGEVFIFEDLGEIQLKGFEEPLRILRVLKTADTPFRRHGRALERTNFVGRAEELDSLRAVILSLCEGRGQIVTVLGDAGIGKSRIVEELRQLLSEEVGEESNDGFPLSSIRWLEGRALSYGESLSYWTIIQLLLADLELSESSPLVKVKVALRKRLEALMGEGIESVYPFLANLLGLAVEGELRDYIQSLDGETVKRQTLQALSSYFKHVAALQPCILIFEDLHWADPTSLVVIKTLCALTEQVPLMILMLMRPEREHGSWEMKVKAETDYHHRYHEVHLNRLAREHADGILCQILGEPEAPRVISDLVQARTEGNPFFIEEVTHYLLERGLISNSEGAWEATESMEDMGIPETLQGVLLARIDRLQEDVRETLQMASVIGRSFLYRILEKIAEADRALEEHLYELQRVDLVREKARLPELEYIFKHSLTQEAAYNSLLHEKRKDFHLQVGEALEFLFSDRQEEYLGLLAHHFSSAEEHEKALSYLIRAGDKARLEDANEEAREYYSRALKLQEGQGDNAGAASTLLKFSLLHLKDFQFESARQAHEAAFELQRRARSRREMAKKLDADAETSLYPFSSVVVGGFTPNLDPAKTDYLADADAQKSIFAGLTELDHELNVIPQVARSWEVLDGGTRYRFHLRDDVVWSDGVPITAKDFHWSWLRVLSPALEAFSARDLDIIDGARAYRLGMCSDPASVGIRALDSYTFEVQLTTPAPYLLYIVSTNIAFPVPRHVVEGFSDNWCHPEHIVSNGPYLLEKNDADGTAYTRNPRYFGDYRGNVSRFEWKNIQSSKEALDLFHADKIDGIWAMPEDDIPSEISQDQIVRTSLLATELLTFNPMLPPLDLLSVRRSLVHAFDRFEYASKRDRRGVMQTLGGIVPPGMAGYSPELGLEYDVAKAKTLLREAGLVRRDGSIPISVAELKYLSSGSLEAIRDAWRENLGIQAKIIADYKKMSMWPDLISEMHAFVSSWTADYPDPDTMLHRSMSYDFLQRTGWPGLAYCDELFDRAAKTQERTKRLEIYREVDRFLVEDQVLIVPIAYGRVGRNVIMIKSWIRTLDINLMGYLDAKGITIEPH